MSNSFEHGATIPVAHTCDGVNLSPHLLFADVPENAKTLVLIMDDPDAPNGTFTHWLVWDMPADVREIPEGTNPPGVLGQNGAGEANYTGPCPPVGEHRYFFKLYALDTELTEKRIANKKDLEHAMEGHILQAAELMGKYRRQQ